MMVMMMLMMLLAAYLTFLQLPRTRHPTRQIH